MIRSKNMDEVVFLILPDVEILDIAGPLQAFAEANRSQARYRIRITSTRRRIQAHQGLTFDDLEPLPEIGEGATVIVPGMPYAATQQFDRAAIRWLKASAAAGAHIASVCTG